MKRLIFTIIALLLSLAVSARQYAFSGESLALYDYSCQRIVDKVPAGTTVVITKDVGTSWVQIRTNTTPTKSGWVQKQNLYEVEIDANGNIIDKPVTPQTPTWKKEVAETLQAFAETPLGHITSLLILFTLLPISLTISISLIVFMVMFAFKFEKLREWFNKKAGMDIMPYDRLDKRLWRGFIFATLIIAATLLVSYMPDTLIPAIAVIALYSIIAIRRRVARLGSGKAAFWEIVYIAFASYIVLLLGVLFFWVIIIILGAKLLAEAGSSSGKSSSGKGGYVYTCKECRHFNVNDGGTTYRCSAYGHGVLRDNEACDAFGR